MFNGSTQNQWPVLMLIVLLHFLSRAQFNNNISNDVTTKSVWRKLIVGLIIESSKELLNSIDLNLENVVFVSPWFVHKLSLWFKTICLWSCNFSPSFLNFVVFLTLTINFYDLADAFKISNGWSRVADIWCWVLAYLDFSTMHDLSLPLMIYVMKDICLPTPRMRGPGIPCATPVSI